MASNYLEDIDYKLISYGTDSELQRLVIYTHKTASQQANLPKKWIMFIHGGAWRDPNNDHHDGAYIISSILKRYPDEYRGASIDYPLSNKSKHPEFALNALQALKTLDQQYQVEEYVLVGHSAGAHIALQTFMFGRFHADLFELTQKCHKVFGVEGIYILDLLTTENEGYRGFTEEAFGVNTAGSWDKASPFSVDPDKQLYHWSTSASDYSVGSSVVPFVNGTLYICHSPTDELLLTKYQPMVTLNILASRPTENAIAVKYCEIAGLHEEAIKRVELIEAIVSNL